MSLTSEKHRVELERFTELLSREAYQVQLVPAAGDVLQDTLLVKLNLWQLELTFLPGLEDELDDVSILQCYVALSDDHTAGENRASLERLIVKLNATLPIGGFGLLDDPRVVFFKHNAILPNDNPVASLQIVHEVVAMIGYLIDAFHPKLTQIVLKESV